MNLKELIFGGGVLGTSARSGAYPGSAQEWLPVRGIVQGVVATTDKRFVKILEVLPVNFYTLSEPEKENIIADFAAYLKIAPKSLQMEAVTQKFDLEGYISGQKKRLEVETNERCRGMIEDNVREVMEIVSTMAVTHRFFLSFEYEPEMKARDNSPGAVAERLCEVADVARRYLDRCGLTLLEPEYSDNAALELLYELINKRTSRRVKLPAGVFDMLTTVHGVYES